MAAIRIVMDLRARRSAEPVLVELPTLHDGREVRALVLEELEIVDRIAVDDEEISESAGGDHTQLPLLTQHAGRHRRGRLDDLERLHHLTPDQELTALLVLELAKQVAAVRDGHAR